MSDILDPHSVYIPEELVAQILTRLPVKSLLRFMSVCKSWYSLIKSPDFITRHFNHQLAISNSSEGATYLLYRNKFHVNRYVVHSDNEKFDIEMEFMLPKDSFVGRVGFCNGIVCLDYAPDRIIVALWNPSLRRFLEIEVPHILGRNRYHSSGFGFDASSNDYKIVSFEYTKPSDHGVLETKSTGVCVYSLNSRTWRWVDTSFVLDGECHIEYYGVHVNGMIYWLVNLDRSFEVGHFPVSILMFNLADESFGQIPVPKELEGPSGCEDAMLITFHSDSSELERLAYVCTENGQSLFNFWVLGVDGITESWKAVLSMKAEMTVESDGVVVCHWPLNVRKNGEVVVVLRDDRIASVNLKDIQKSFILHDSQGLYDYMGTYLESLYLI